MSDFKCINICVLVDIDMFVHDYEILDMYMC